MSLRIFRKHTETGTAGKFIRKTSAGLAATLVVAVGVAGCNSAATTAGSPASPATTGGIQDANGAQVFPSSQVHRLAAGVTKKTPKQLPTKRLASGLVPPTNRWFSGLVFGNQPQPVFPLPLSFGLTGSGFAFGLPTVTTSAKTITGGYKPDVAVDTGAHSARVSAYDTLTVTVDSLDGGGSVLGKTTIAEGSPFVRYTATKSGTVTTKLPFTKTGDYWTAKAGTTTYGLVVNGGKVTGSSIQLDKGGSATWFALPTNGSAAKLAKLASHPVTGSTLRYGIKNGTARTKLGYTAKGGTAFAAMPHQQKTLTGANCDLGTYPSSYGTLKLCSGKSLNYTAPVSQPTSALDLSRLSGDEKKQLSAQVTKDIAGTPAFPADTYFGGKALYRGAMLYQLAKQLHLSGPAADMRKRLTDQLTMWTDPHGCQKRPAFCFVYDSQGKGLVGLTPSFGSDQYNDHHFHYGYFLYAAGVLTADDPALAKKFAPVMDLVAADIGSNADNGSFPNLRVFDPYAGHSWASGTAPFADGNNQESSSEAVNAWTGLALWGKSSGNTALQAEGTWMRSNEAQSALAYWTNFDTSDPVYKGFGHKIVSLNWGGKRDYATWFSPAPAAMLGIQLIPMSPASTYLAGDSARITANVQEASGGNFNQQFGDYLLMYSALAGDPQRKAALAKAETLNDKWIDNADSKSYLLAWLMTVKG